MRVEHHNAVLEVQSVRAALQPDNPQTSPNQDLESERLPVPIQIQVAFHLVSLGHIPRSLLRFVEQRPIGRC